MAVVERVAGLEFDMPEAIEWGGWGKNIFFGRDGEWYGRGAVWGEVVPASSPRPRVLNESQLDPQAAVIGVRRPNQRPSAAP